MFEQFTIQNPFPGLRAFEEEEDVLFFGREKQVDDLLKILRTARFMAVIGSSGSGKSSLVKSGLIPSLHSGFMSGAGSSWRICTFRPGTNPIANMAEALAADKVIYDKSMEQEERLTMAAINESILRRSSNGLTEVYRQSGLDPRNNLLILVDQFEELFRFSRIEKDAREGRRDSVAFINLLLKATEQRQFPIYVVFTMRSDFLGDCTEFRGLPEAINEGQYLVPRMTREERKDAITGPVSVGGAGISQRLVNTLLNDVGDNPDQLPILQHAMMRTWQHWQSQNHPQNELDIEDYESIGTMEFALSRHAEEAWSELKGSRQQKLAELLFKAITDKGSDARGIRRPRRFSDIAALSGASLEELIPVADIFRKKGRGFLMPPETISLHADSIIDISHESIMRVWERLINWLDEENESAQTYLRLCEASTLYEQSKGGLLRDPELQVALKWKQVHEPNASWAERYNQDFPKAMLFLESSRAKWAQEQHHKDMLQKQRLQRARRVVALVSVVAVAALFLAIYSFQQKNEANRQTTIATLKTREAIEQQNIAQQQKKLALNSRQEALEQKQKAELSEQDALNQKSRAEQERIRALQSEQNALLQKSLAETAKANAERQRKFAEDQRTEAERQTLRANQQTSLAEKSEEVAQRELKISTRLRSLSEARNKAYQSQLLLNEGRAQESLKEAMESFELNKEFNGPRQNSDVFNALHFSWIQDQGGSNIYSFHSQPVKAISGANSQEFFVSGDEAGNLMLQRRTGDQIRKESTFRMGTDVRVARWNAAGTVLAAGGANGLLHALGMNGTELQILQTWKLPALPQQLLFTPANELLVLAGSQLYLAESGKPARILPFARPVQRMSQSPGGQIALALAGELLIFKNIGSLAEPALYRFDSPGMVTSLQFSPDGTLLAAGTYTGNLWISPLKKGAAVYNKAIHKSSINDLAFSSVEGRLQMATAGADQEIHLLDVADALGEGRADVLTLRGHTKWIYALSYSADGHNLYSVSEDSRLILWKPSASLLYQALKK